MSVYSSRNSVFKPSLEPIENSTKKSFSRTNSYNPKKNSITNSIRSKNSIYDTNQKNSIRSKNSIYDKNQKNSINQKNTNSIYSKNKKYDTERGSIYKIKEDIKNLPTDITDIQDDAISDDNNGLSTIKFDDKHYLLNQHQYVVNDEIEILKRKLRDLEKKNLILNENKKLYEKSDFLVKNKDYVMKEENKLLKFKEKHGFGKNEKNGKNLTKRDFYHKRIFRIENKFDNKGVLNFGKFLKTNYNHTNTIRENFVDLSKIKKDKEEFLLKFVK